MLLSVPEDGVSLKCIVHNWESISLFGFLFHSQQLGAVEGYQTVAPNLPYFSNDIVPLF